MLTDSERHAAALERLSALADGELDAAAVTQACGHWRESAESRATWHAYHLIGDVLRSDDLAVDPARDTAFMQAFRARLANEPVVIAPQPLETRGRNASPSAAAVAHVANGAHARRWSWMMPSAVAAGFAAVAGVMVLSRAPATLPERQAQAPLAQASPEPGRVAQARLVAAPVAAGPIATSVEPQALMAGGPLVRDARLDRYLAAHKQFAGSSALGVPSAFLRNATADAADR